MTAVRVARVERRIPPGPVPTRYPTHVIVLAETLATGSCPSAARHDGMRISALFVAGGTRTRRTPGPSGRRDQGQHRRGARRAAVARCRGQDTGVDIDETGPGARGADRLTGLAGSGNLHGTLPTPALAITAGRGSGWPSCDDRLRYQRHPTPRPAPCPVGRRDARATASELSPRSRALTAQHGLRRRPVRMAA